MFMSSYIATTFPRLFPQQLQFITEVSLMSTIATKTLDSSVVCLMDGGMASHLETLGYQPAPSAASNPSLWSSGALISNEELVKQVHRDYINAGATVLSTCTYQLSLETAGSSTVAKHLMQKAVELLNEEILKHGREILCLLSLGSCAIAQKSGTEYSGDYVYPYSSSDDKAHSTQIEFHLTRLRLLSDSAPHWDMIDGILFETVSLLSEIQSIRSAVSSLFVNDRIPPKKLFITMVFPDSRFPGWGREGVAADITIDEGITAIMKAAFSDGPDTCRVDGIGINCTNPDFILPLVKAFSYQVGTFRDKHPTLLLYPNGGLFWNPDLELFEGELKVEQWAKMVIEAAQFASDLDKWDRIIIGGCCNTSPAHIRNLSVFL